MPIEQRFLHEVFKIAPVTSKFVSVFIEWQRQHTILYRAIIP